ncbi:MAG TPA: FliG C-terminal domain-containing protein [Elusimicrobiota bacterium]|nr:FliG C-terminal domain-containing protein [Elusimicrobiota bacterium]
MTTGKIRKITKRGKVALFLFWAALAAGARAGAVIVAPDLGLLKEQNRIKQESEQKIDQEILDPILGKDEAMAFVDVAMQLKVDNEETNRKGMGLAEKYKEKTNAQKSGQTQTQFVLPGIPQPESISRIPQAPSDASAQQAQEQKGMQEENFSENLVFKKMTVTVIHDQSVLKDKAQQDLVRSRIVDAMAQYNLSPNQVFFSPTPFNHAKTDWREDLKHPWVYLPLLYAVLILLFLLYLFGPLWRFLSQYIRAMRERPAAEVNVESKIEQPDEDEGEGDDQLEEEGKLDITLQRKPDEPPPPPPEEDEDMKKFEPFAYINEENIKRLAYMFLLRKEEPWVVAVVASYLRPDYARQLLTSLPVEFQARVAMEALTVRQVTREQVVAIDADVKENVDFVVGGLERLITMIDEADTATRNNILNYLKNEKPLVYEHVRRHLLVFEDTAGFPDREMQLVIRELKPEGMAKALQNAPPEVLNKFFNNMSAGAAAMLKEAMEYSQNITPTQIEEERAKIMDTVKVLEKEGKIAIRNKEGGGYDLVEGMQEELSAQTKRQERFAAAKKKNEPAALPGGGQETRAAADPAQAQNYLNAGVSFHDAGQFEQSVPYLEYALTLDPNLWQARQYLGSALYQLGRTPEALAQYEKMLEAHPDPQIQQWVESFKAQIKG